MTNKVSIILPLYNKEQFVALSIESVLNQTYTNFELIIINDCSNDDSLKIAEKYQSTDDRIVILHNEENIGITRSLNKGLRSATGNYIARIDGDDIWLPDKLQIQFNAFDADKDLMFVATSKINIDKNNNILTDFAEPGAMLHDDIKRHMLCKGNVFVHASVMFKKEIIDEVGYYNEKYMVAQDVDYFARIIHKFKVEILPDVLVHYRVSHNMHSLKHRRKAAKILFLTKLKWIFKNRYPIPCYLGLIPELLQFLKPEFVIRMKQKMMKVLFNKTPYHDGVNSDDYQ